MSENHITKVAVMVDFSLNCVFVIRQTIMCPLGGWVENINGES